MKKSNKKFYVFTQQKRDYFNKQYINDQANIYKEQVFIK